MPQSADKKPEKYIGPDGKPKIRMVPVDKEVIKQEGAMKRMVTTQSNKADRMASTDKKGLETYKKKVDEISLDQLKSKISSTGMKSTKKAMGADKIKKDLEAMKAKLATEEKDPEEYDNEGSMMKSQLRQICSANEKLMSMVKDDDNLPEWVQSKVTKATDYIRSVRDYLESEKMEESVDWVCGKCNCDPCTCGEEIEEKTLTPAEKRKREKIAKAIEKDNPDMPMDKKMAIATATAKRVAEDTDSVDEAVGTSAKYAGKSGMFGGKYTSKDRMMDMPLAKLNKIRDKRQAQNKAAHDKQDPKMSKMGYAKHMLDTDKADAKARKRGIDPTGQYDKYKKRNNIKDSVEVDEILDTPKAMQSYRDKNKRSKEKAANSAAAKILRGPDADGNRADHSPELKTMAKRRSGEKMVDRLAGRKTFKALRGNK